MSVDLGQTAGGGQQLSDDAVIALARDAIDASREEIRRGRDVAVSTELQQPGVTVDLCHRNIVRLPDEVIDIIKDEIERLAISHNRVSSFPARLSECKRLRYLNVRYNQLKEVPKPILQLSSLEILDISRNKLRSLPDEISNLTSLKVLAIQRNRIERLPLCLGDMSSLIRLKLDDNPLTFPPPQIWRPRQDQTFGAEVEAQVTLQIKKFLRQQSNANSTRQRLQVESDSEISEGAVETPRPHRQPRTRFPVRPSITNLDALSIPNSISPEGPPPIPARSHNRIRSSQSSIASRNNLLSPPDYGPGGRDYSLDGTASDITVRPKRHGIITPRTAEQPKSMFKSPSTPRSAFNSPESLSSLDQTDRTGNMTNFSEMGQSLFTTINRFGRSVMRELQSVKWGLNRSPYVPQELLVLLNNVEAARRNHNEYFMEKADWPNRNSSDRREVIRVAQTVLQNDCMALGQFAEGMRKYMKDIVARDVTNARARAIYFQLLEITQSMKIAMQFANFLEQHPEQLFSPRVQLGAPLVPQRMSNGDRPRTNASYSNPPSRLGWNNDSGPSITYTQIRDDRTHGTTTDDFLFENILTSLNTVVTRCNDGLSKIYNHLIYERQESERTLGDNHPQVMALGRLVQHFNELMLAVKAMSKALGLVAVRPEMRESEQDFWTHVRKALRDWGTFIQLARDRALGPQPFPPAVKNVFKPIHVSVKAASQAITNSPWAAPNPTSTVPPATHRKHPSGGSVPSTPLSAALGPAAQATMPSGPDLQLGVRMPGVGLQPGQKMPPGSRINFFERADRYERESREQGRPPFRYERRYGDSRS